MQIVLIKGLVIFLVFIALIIAIFHLFLHIKQTKDTILYTALGDSIAEGAGATENRGYTYLLNQYYQGLYKTVDYNNLAQSGDTSGDLLKKLNTSDKMKEAVKKADVITVCIGGNDLLSGVDKLLEGDLLSLEDRINAFSVNLEEVLATIKELNSKAEIYAMDLYNPISIGDSYHGVRCDKQLWEIINGGIRKLNDIITSRDYQNKYKYKVANVYSAFQQYSYQGQRLTGFQKGSDPHPTDEGHQVIFEQYLLIIPKTE